MFEGSIKGISRMFQGSFKGVSGKNEGCSERPSKRSSKDFLREFHGSFNDDLSKF